MTTAVWLGLASTGWAEELRFAILDLPVTAFTREELTGFPENGQADAAAVLKKRGFEMPDGSSAFFEVASGRIFLRSTERDLRHLAQVAEDQPAASSEVPFQVQLSATCYAIPVSAVPVDFGPQSPLSSLPADRLAVVDRTTLVCRSGQRSKVENAPLSDDSGEGSKEKYTGTQRALEMECTVSDDGFLMDINMAWEIHTPLLAPAGERGSFRLTNQLMLRPGRLVTQELGITSEAEPRLVVLALQAEILKPAVPPLGAAPEKPAPRPDK